MNSVANMTIGRGESSFGFRIRLHRDTLRASHAGCAARNKPNSVHLINSKLLKAAGTPSGLFLSRTGPARSQPTFTMATDLGVAPFPESAGGGRLRRRNSAIGSERLADWEVWVRVRDYIVQLF
jgi:hypothetical protein